MEVEEREKKEAGPTKITNRALEDKEMWVKPPPGKVMVRGGM